MTPRMGGYVPADHKTRHQDGGRDEISIADLEGEGVELAAHAALAIAHGTVDDIADQTDIATHAADLDAHTRHMLQTFKVEEYFTQPGEEWGSTAVAATDYMYASPIVIARNMTVDRIAINVTTLAAGAHKARLGIYADSAFTPGAQVNAGGEIDTAATGLQAVTISQALTKGIYWLTVAVSDNVYFYRPRAVFPIRGFDASYNFPVAMGHRIFAYGALPDPWGTVGIWTLHFHPILLRVASLD